MLIKVANKSKGAVAINEIFNILHFDNVIMNMRMGAAGSRRVGEWRMESEEQESSSLLAQS